MYFRGKGTKTFFIYKSKSEGNLESEVILCIKLFRVPQVLIVQGLFHVVPHIEGDGDAGIAVQVANDTQHGVDREAVGVECG